MTIENAAHCAEIRLQHDADRLVAREVYLNVSACVTTLAGEGRRPAVRADLADLCDQAAELTAPVLDYEAAALEAGWNYEGTALCRDATEYEEAAAEDGRGWYLQIEPRTPGIFVPNLGQLACERDGIEPHDREVYEHWAVSTWLAEKLTEAGEKVNTDFCGWNVWARTTTGQAIAMDGIIREITKALHAT